MSYILGPDKFIILKSFNGSIIYMFGETHEITENKCNVDCNVVNCYEISQILTEIFKITKSLNKTVEFLIEIPKYITEIPEEIDTYMGIYNIYKDFYNEFELKNRIYTNVFFDKIDIRTTFEYDLFKTIDFSMFIYEYLEILGNTEIEQFQEFLKILINRNIYFELVRIYIFSDNFISDIIALLSNIENKYIKRFLQENVDNLKQFHQVNFNGKSYSLVSILMYKLDKNIFTPLKDFILNGMIHANKNLINEIENSYNAITYKAEKAFDESIQYIDIYLVALIAYVLDARILSNYFVNDYNLFNYYIFYFGRSHIKRYLRFFKKIGFTVLSFNKNPSPHLINEENCVEINNIDEIFQNLIM